MPKAKKFNVQFYRDARPIDKMDLDTELITQVVFYGDICDENARAMSEEHAARENQRSSSAILVGKIRSKLEKETGKRPTEADTTAALEGHEVHIASREHYKGAQAYARDVAELKESWLARSHALKVLCELYSSGYWMQNTAGTKKGKKNARTA